MFVTAFLVAFLITSAVFLFVAAGKSRKRRSMHATQRPPAPVRRTVQAPQRRSGVRAGVSVGMNGRPRVWASKRIL